MQTAFYEDEKSNGRESDFGPGAAFRALLPFLNRYRWRLIGSLGLLLAATAATLFWPLLVQRAIDGAVEGPLALPDEARRFAPLLGYSLAVLAIQVAGIFLRYRQRISLESVGQDVMYDLRRRLFGHIVSLPVSFFDAHPVGRLMARVESDTESLRLLFANVVVLVVGDLLLMAGLWGMMFFAEKRLALAVLAVTPFVAGALYAFHRLTTHRFLEVRRKMADVTATLTEFLHAMAIVQIFHRGEYARRCMNRANRAKFDEEKFVEISFCVLFNMLFLLEHIKIGLVIFLGTLWGVTPGVVVLFILLVWQEFEPIARAADQLGSFQKVIAGARRIFSLLALKSDIEERADPAPWPAVRDAIRFENVWFSYRNDGTWALRDVTLEIPAGSRVALAGVTGGGKTTILSLLLRMYDPQRGRITVDGVDIRDLSVADLRRRFALVLQDIILFPGSVRSNITLDAPDVDDRRMRLAAEAVDADRFVRKLPVGYDTEVSEKGANFSRGERQLLSFARALVVDPEVLLLDEATGSIDPETERTVRSALGALMKGRTSLVIAHRLSTILDADTIVVIAGGRIVERGSHAELLERGGVYAKLFQLQFKRPEREWKDAG